MPPLVPTAWRRVDDGDELELEVVAEEGQQHPVQSRVPV